MPPNPQETTDLVLFTDEVFNGKIHFVFALCENACSTIVIRTDLRLTDRFNMIDKNALISKL